MDVNVDAVDGLGRDGYVREARQTIHGEVLVSTSGRMVMQIIERLGSNRMRRLRIFGHGAPGVQGLGNSHTTMDPNQLLQLDASGRLVNEGVLVMLRASFAPNGWAELHGCEVGRGPAGQALLRELTRVWGVPVRAGVAIQTAQPGFEGRTSFCRPAPSGIQCH